jgi:hypothetical protein
MCASRNFFRGTRHIFEILTFFNVCAKSCLDYIGNQQCKQKFTPLYLIYSTVYSTDFKIGTFFSLDCHAEIVSRRCLVHYLYMQLESLACGEDSIFIPRSPENSQGGYKLKVCTIVLISLSTLCRVQFS